MWSAAREVLNDAQYEALELRIASGLSWRQMSKALGVSRQTCKDRVDRALQLVEIHTNKAA